VKNAVVIVDPDIRINQQVALGLAKGLQKHDDWDIQVLSRHAPLTELKRRVHAIAPDAVAVRAPYTRLVEHIDGLSIPFVVVADEGPVTRDTSVVVPDDEVLGEMATEYLLSQGFEHFAIVDSERGGSAPRLEVFFSAIQGKGKTLNRFELLLGEVTDHPFGGYGNPDELAEWLHQLPKPCAIFAHSDQPGAYVIRTCKRNGIRVPGDISVLGVDDDPLFCHAVKPNLASIHLPYRRIGIEAARMILDWRPGRRLCKVPPTTVAERASCRPPARGDLLVDMAVEHLRTHVSEGVRVRDLQKLTGLTPHQLIYRFNIVTGRTPMEMILRRRIAVAKQLLAETTQPVADVARQSGFNSPTQFYVTFRNRVGVSPSDYRSRLAP